MVALVFPLALYLVGNRIQGWTFYLTSTEVAFEIFVRLMVAALAGILLGTLLSALAAPVLLLRSRNRLAKWMINGAAVIVIFVVARCALTSLIAWSYLFGGHKSIFDAILLKGYAAVFLAALLIPRSRKEILESLAPLLKTATARGIVIAMITLAFALVLTEFLLGKAAPPARAAAPRPNSNIVLITFDALSVEDVSFYGYGLPTTPNIDAFARTGTVFDRYYSSSTFTTPALATLMTGVYPSQCRIHQLQGTARGEVSRENLAQLLREGGYATGSFVSNPFGYNFVRSLEGFDILPEPEFRNGSQATLWALTAPFHQNSGVGNRIDEYMDLEGLINVWRGTANNRSLRFRPTASFEQARQILAQLPEGFFLWVHILAPHDPYLPDAPDQNRFVPEPELQGFLSDNERFQPVYKPEQQHLIDRRRLAYDEYVASADRAFGSFMADLEKNGKLKNATVIVSSDHGESFQGGVYRHETAYLTRPVVHVPLIIHTPGQQTGKRVEITADQTSLAPTILELAGQGKPEWMRGQSLARWLSGDQPGSAEGQAFSEYLEKNSIFKPLHHGSIGMIDGQYEYVLYLDTQKGELRPLNSAHIWNFDATSQDPARAERMRRAIFAKFPELSVQSK